MILRATSITFVSQCGKVGDQVDCADGWIIDGILGMYQKFLLGSRPLPSRLRPDYNRTVDEVMSDVAKLAIEEQRQLAILTYVSHRSDSEVDGIGMPSWVPKYHRKQDLKVDHLPLNFSSFAASGDTIWCNASGGTIVQKHLNVKGFDVGVVVEVTDVFDYDALRDRNKLWALVNSARALNRRGGMEPGALERTLVAGHNHQRTDIDHRQSVDGFAAMWDHLEAIDTVPSIYQKHDDPYMGLAGPYYEALTRWTLNRRLFRTNTRHLGLGPKMLQGGDIVVILYGAPVPMVLRHRTQTGTFAYVGDAYCDGIMSGQAVAGHEARGGADNVYLLS
jgi:hypothetical protein